MIKVDGRIISIVQKNTGSVQFNMFGPDRTKFDLTNYVLVFMVKKSRKDADSSALIVKKIAPEAGHMAKFVLLPTDTDLPIGTYWWGVQLKQGNYVNEFASGPFHVIDGVVNDW